MTARAGPDVWQNIVRKFLGRKMYFFDIESLEPGIPYPEAIKKRIGLSDVLLVVIGPRWLSVTDENGLRRLDDPFDFTCLEIEQGLQRQIRVIPVLVGGGRMP